MEDLIQIAFHRPTVSPNGLTHGRSRRSRRCEQCYNKPPRLGGVKLNLVAFGNNLASHFKRVNGNKFGQRAALDGGGFTEKLFVRCGYPGDESLAFKFFQCRRHAQNVCLGGTQIKNYFMPHAYTEDQLVEQPAIGLFVDIGWQTVSAMGKS